MDSDRHTDLCSITSDNSQFNSGPAMPPLTCAKQTGDIRLNAGVSRCETEHAHWHNSEQTDSCTHCTEYRPRRQEQNLSIDVPRSARSSPSLTWSSSATLAEPAIAKWRERTGLMIIAEGFLQVCRDIYPSPSIMRRLKDNACRLLSAS